MRLTCDVCDYDLCDACTNGRQGVDVEVEVEPRPEPEPESELELEPESELEPEPEPELEPEPEPAAAAAAVHPALASVCTLGFPEEAASVALAACGGDVQQAIESMLVAAAAEPLDAVFAKAIALGMTDEEHVAKMHGKIESGQFTTQHFLQMFTARMSEKAKA